MDSGLSQSFNAKGKKTPKEPTPEQRAKAIQEITEMTAMEVEALKPGSRERLTVELWNSKSAYDAEFDRIHQQFGPLLNDLDNGKPRNIIFIDPSEYAGAKALGIDTREYISMTLMANGGYANQTSVFMMDMQMSVDDKRTRNAAPKATNPSSMPIGGACVIVPLSHFGNTGVDMKGMTAGEISTYVNYHEFFHCLNDVYRNDTSYNVGQKRETFADIGAAMEMVRRGSDPKIIDRMIEWREKQLDADHYTVNGLKTLKAFIAENGADKIKTMSQKDVIALDYVLTESSASSRWEYKMLQIRETLRTPGPLTRYIGSLFEGGRPDALPKGFDPQKALEEKAFRIGGKVTPVTLLQANNELQVEYRAQYDKGSGLNEMYPQMMIATQDAFMKTVKSMDYEAVNRARKATLSAEDREDIAFVKSGGKPPAAAKPAPAAAKPKS
jgi:hypothetical protein